MTKTNVLITGRYSMIGRAIEKYLLTYPDLCVFGSKHTGLCDLTNVNAVYDEFKASKPDYVIHLASLNGNIQFNNLYPADIFRVTTQIGKNVLEASVRFNVKKVLSVLSSCSYPSNPSGLLTESDYWNGSPDPSVESHGFAKRFLMEYGRQLYKQCGLSHIGMVINTCYGPYDSYDLNKTKVVGSLIKKFVDAVERDTEVTLWGTGEVRREFIYCDDVGKYACDVLYNYHDPLEPINIGCGKDYSIKILAEIVAGKAGYKKDIYWDASKPDGQKRKLLVNKKMKKIFGDLKFVSLGDGIEKTIEYYRTITNG